MILVLSRYGDYSTNKVIDWLTGLKANFFRLNDEDLALGKVKISFDIDEESFFLETKNGKITMDDINIVWLRKFGFLDTYEDFFKENDPASNLKKYTYSEFSELRGLLYSFLKDKKWLYYKDNMPSKIDVLRVAKDSGLKIPKTTVTNKFTYVQEGYGLQGEVITKSLGQFSTIQYKDYSKKLLTQKFKTIELEGKSFFPSLFQEYIDKEYELRIFYLDGSFYSMAIFSQKNRKTIVDFRNYDYDNPSRNVPYKLPYTIQKKLDHLMKNLGLNTGSIDMIRSVNGDYVFLEVNPSGQYGMVSNPCNYPLDKLIAQYLIKNDKNEKTS